MRQHRIGCASFLVVLLLVLVSPATAQKRDPLNPKEIDEMRDVADWPNKRIELLVTFVRTRMNKIQELETDAKTAKDRPMQIHDLLQDVTALLDEIDDNMDMYSSHKADMRKGLTLLIEGDSEWQLQLRRLKAQSPPEEMEQYSFVLDNATDAVNDMAGDARDELQQQNQWAKEKQLTKDYSERRN